MAAALRIGGADDNEARLATLGVCLRWALRPTLRRATASPRHDTGRAVADSPRWDEELHARGLGRF